MNDLQKQELRHAVLAAVALRHPTALSVRQLTHRVAMEIDFAIETPDVISAVEVLKGLGHLEVLPDPYGMGTYYRASAEGMLAFERRRSGTQANIG